MSTTLFVDLAGEKGIRTNPSPLLYEGVVRMLIEAAADNELLVSDRRIGFRVDRRSLEVLSGRRVLVDHVLLEQVINNVLDNAGKYSFPDTQVRVYGGLSAKGRVFVGVANKGLRLQQSELQFATQRGWRGDEAEWTTGEGSGLGLWIVDCVLRAHGNGAELVITPTNSVGLTDMKLILPTF
jgi:two-component system OmpR family sensor kinase